MTTHYFTSQEPSDHLQQHRVIIRNKEYCVYSAPGVFSARHLDKATEVLLNAFVPPSTTVATVADIGCGWGPISLALAQEFPHAELWATDVNERALDLARLNLPKRDNIHVVHDDEAFATIEEDDVFFDVIVSNPPVRIGKKALYSLIERWAKRLHPHGEMWIVMGKHLGADSLGVWLTQRGYTVERVGSKKGFRILCITQGKKD
ncbi:MAG: methyltransferase [Actinomycetaceae bacterium]|nr:methyltransferase [Actinomycetaceae bacterium]